VLAAVLVAALSFVFATSSDASAPSGWVEALANKTELDAYQKLDRAEDPAVVAAIIEGMRHPSPRVRARCCRLIGRTRAADSLPPEAESMLKGRLNDPSRAVRVQAAGALLAIGNLSDLDRMLSDPQVSVHAREALARALASDDPQFGRVLLRWVRDPHQIASLRELAGILLVLPRYAGFAADIARLSEDPSLPIGLRALAIQAMGSSGRSAAYDALLRRTRDGRLPVPLRDAALMGLGYSGDPRAIPVLGKVIANPRLPIGTRCAALLGVGRSRLPEALPVLQVALRDSSHLIRKTAVDLLDCLADPSMIPMLRAAADRECVECNEDALRALVERLESRQRSGACQ